MRPAYEPLERIGRCRIITDAFRLTPPETPFVTMWEPADKPEFKSLSFGEFLRLSRSYARLLKDNGVVKKDTVALILPQGVDLMAAFVGTMLLGGVPTILAYPNSKIDPEKYRRGLSGVTRNIEARLTVVDHSFPDNFLKQISEMGENRILKASHERLPPPAEDLLEKAEPGDIAFLQHSAGTTGLQKGVALSHRTLLNQLLPLAEALQLNRDDRIVSWLPLYHDMGLVACFMLPLVAGIPVIMQSPVDWVMRPDSFLRLITLFGCTVSWIPNFAFQFMARRIPPAQRSNIDLSSLKALTTTSEPIRAHSIKEFEEAYSGCGLRPGAIQTSYGMAESTFAVTQSVLGERPRTIFVNRRKLLEEQKIQEIDPADSRAYTFVSCGKCLRNNRVRVVSAEGRDLAEGGVGEILVQTDYLFEGYYRRPDLTREVLKEGWYWTGDTGFILGRDVFVIGRKDDMIIVGGSNIYPQDLEEIAFQNSAIHDGRAVAFGIFNPRLGTQDIVIVAEVGSEEDLGRQRRIAGEIREEVLMNLGVAPRHVEIVEPRWLIKSTAGKPARSANRDKFLALRPDIADLYRNDSG